MFKIRKSLASILAAVSVSLLMGTASVKAGEFESTYFFKNDFLYELDHMFTHVTSGISKMFGGLKILWPDEGEDQTVLSELATDGKGYVDKSGTCFHGSIGFAAMVYDDLFEVFIDKPGSKVSFCDTLMLENLDKIYRSDVIIYNEDSKRDHAIVVIWVEDDKIHYGDCDDNGKVRWGNVISKSELQEKLTHKLVQFKNSDSSEADQLGFVARSPIVDFISRLHETLPFSIKPVEIGIPDQEMTTIDLMSDISSKENNNQLRKHLVAEKPCIE